MYFNREHNNIAEKIRNFLNIEEGAADNDFVESSSEEEDTVDDFEHIDQSDLVDETDKSSLPQTDDIKCDVPPSNDVPEKNE